MLVYHVSDRAGITRFEPRPATEASAVKGDIVWAIDEEHLPNYLLPRDCPRVCFAQSERTTDDDIRRFLPDTSAKRVICVEWDWLNAIRTSLLHVYSLDAATFECIDSGAGYYVSREPIAPESGTPVTDLLEEMRHRGVELRFMSDLWPLHDAVAKSSLEFSMIRMRNARPRP